MLQERNLCRFCCDYNRFQQFMVDNLALALGWLSTTNPQLPCNISHMAREGFSLPVQSTKYSHLLSSSSIGYTRNPYNGKIFNGAVRHRILHAAVSSITYCCCCSKSGNEGLQCRRMGKHCTHPNKYPPQKDWR